MKAAAISLKERGIEKPSNSRKRQKATKLNGAHASKPNGAAPHASSKPLIAEWLELVETAKAITSNAFARLVMSHLKLIVAKIEPPPCVASPSDMAIDDFAQSLAKMIVELLTEILTESDEVVWKRIEGMTLVECLGPRPAADRPRSQASAYPVSLQMREKPLHEKDLHELEDEHEFQKWLAARQAREGAAT